MKRELIIATKHSDNKPKKKLVVELSGGSPWYGYIWLNGECYAIIEGERVFKISKTK